MPGSRSSALASLAHVAGSLALIGGLLWTSAYLLVTSRPSLRLYYRPFGSAVAHKFAAALSAVARQHPSVLLLGVSSTHDGFDEQAMDRSAPGWAFSNGGTSMGSVFVYEALGEMTRDYAVRPTILVIGLHPVALCDRQINFNGAGYTDFFDRWHGWGILALDDPHFLPDNRREALLNTLWPGHRLSRQLSRLIRRGLFTLHRRLYWGVPLPRGAFEHSPDDLRPQPRYFYTDTAPLPNRAAHAVRWFEETITECAAPRHRESLRRTLESALAVTPRVVVLLMPEHSLLRERVSASLRGTLLDVVAEYRGRGVVVLDRSEAMPDALFRDALHLLAEGRGQFSRDVAREVVRLWPSPPG